VVPSTRGSSGERRAFRRETAFALVAEPRHETAQEVGLPNYYYLDESDPDMVVLRRDDGAFVAAFSARGATKEGLVEAAREDYGALTRRSA
jgi:hypothetical protein